MCLAIPCGLPLDLLQNFERCSGGESDQARMLRISLSSKYLDLILDDDLEEISDDDQHLDYSWIGSMIQFLRDERISPDSPLRNKRSVWVEYLTWIEGLRELPDSAAAHVFFPQLSQMVISHGADRWMRSQTKFEQSKSKLKPPEPLLASGKDVFTILRKGLTERM
jgi:hypothetical protein